MTPIIQLGIGGVGRALARQIVAVAPAIRRRYGIDLRYIAIADSRGIIAGDPTVSEEQVHQILAVKEAGHGLDSMTNAITDRHWIELLPATIAIVVDVTATSEHTAPLAAAVSAGHRVVLANKRPLCDEYDLFTALTERGATRYEATVGAGLPVIGVLQGLLDTGDEVLRIEAALSGTLGFLMSALEEGSSFAEAVWKAHALGYTEPDPRDDLSGADVARKALILARTCGIPVPADAVSAESLFPPQLATVSVAEFLQRLPEAEESVMERFAAARAAGNVLRYITCITPDNIEVGLRELPADHPLAGLRGPDNMISFTTRRYHDRPMVIRGPGAGVEVTATGVLSDIIATAREL
ncbi:homoserine dehydrogenase family protein [Chloroflexus aggregans]|uniref:Homoserine dehydrogenase n=1 Tax=Chloroflexus aggregans (strain MD-66 / DSM 9485) TaxID=326427 RepID=B8G6J5_CHLAD|nr:homoserine dehydrogenase [Chloroflexus aggregans]ACL23932.1 Homoserine dehydrogenase [Chloroflexus aggregans DSM 9485]